MIKVSIIVPIYNVENYLKRCLDSLVNQTLQEIEIICVNDGSPDDSQSIVNQFLKEYPDKIISVQKENGGLADARNYGLNYVQGDYILFIDSDDWVEHTMCEKMYEVAVKEQADLVVCDIKNSYDDGHTVYISCGQFEVGNVIEEPMLITIDNSACNKLFHKHLFEEIKFPTGIWFEDLGCIPRVIADANKVVKVNEAYYYYYQREGSIMNTYSDKSLDIYKALSLVKEALIEKYPTEVEFLYIKNLMLYGCSRHLNIEGGETYLNEAIDFMHKTYPEWSKNKYMKQLSRKDQFILKLYYRKQFNLVKAMLYLKRKLTSCSS